MKNTNPKDARKEGLQGKRPSRHAAKAVDMKEDNSKKDLLPWGMQEFSEKEYRLGNFRQESKEFSIYVRERRFAMGGGERISRREEIAYHDAKIGVQLRRFHGRGSVAGLTMRRPDKASIREGEADRSTGTGKSTKNRRNLGFKKNSLAARKPKKHSSEGEWSLELPVRPEERTRLHPNH